MQAMWEMAVAISFRKLLMTEWTLSYSNISLDCGDKRHEVGKSARGALRIGQQTLGAGGNKR